MFCKVCMEVFRSFWHTFKYVKLLCIVNLGMEFSLTTVCYSNPGDSALDVPNHGRTIRLSVPNLFTCTWPLKPEIVKMCFILSLNSQRKCEKIYYGSLKYF